MEAMIRRVFERRAAGDVEGMLQAAADDIVYRMNGWQGGTDQIVRHGKPALIELFREININLENLGSDIHDIVIDDPLVVLRRTSHIRHRGTNQTVAIEMCNFFTFRDGLIVEAVEFADVAALWTLHYQ
jgi:ketosteroid isomerase-like protein